MADMPVTIFRKFFRKKYKGIQAAQIMKTTRSIENKIPPDSFVFTGSKPGKTKLAISKSNTGTTLTSKLQSYTEGYYQLAIYALIAGLILIVLTPLIKKLMQEVK